jgi:hypothetical protein
MLQKQQNCDLVLFRKHKVFVILCCSQSAISIFSVVCQENNCKYCHALRTMGEITLICFVYKWVFIKFCFVCKVMMIMCC